MFRTIEADESSIVSLAQRVRYCLSRVTGTAVDALEHDLDLADDLGLDSIKLVAVLNDLAAFVDEEVKAKLPILLSGEATDCRTVGDLIALCGGRAEPEPEPDAQGAAQASADWALPTALAQYPFLAAHWAISTCSICTRVRVRATLNRALVQRAWDLMRQRHPALAGYFANTGQATTFAGYEFRAAPELPSKVSWLDITRLTEDARADVVRESVHSELNRTWDISVAPLCRLSVYACGEDTFEILLSNHHLVADGLSLQIVVRELLEVCGALLQGISPALPAPIALADYAQLVAELNAGIQRRAQEANAVTPRSAPASSQRAKHARARTEIASHRLEASELSQLKQARRGWQATLCGLLLTAYTRALSARGRQAQSFVINVPTSGRAYGPPELGRLVGCFAQNVAIEVKFDASLLEQVRETQAALDHKLGDGQDAKLTFRAASLLRSAIPLEGGRPNALTCGIMRQGMNSDVYLSYIGDTKLLPNYGPLCLLDYEAATTTNPGALDLVVEEVCGQLQLVANFDAQAFTACEVQKILEDVRAELRQLVHSAPSLEATAGSSTSAQAGPQVREIIAELMASKATPADMGSDLETELGVDSLQRVRLARTVSERFPGAQPEQVLHCRTPQQIAEYLDALVPAQVHANPVEETPLASFLSWARRAPNAIAVRYQGREVSYCELDRWSRAVAERLRRGGVQAGSLVGVFCARGPDMLACNLGILRAGAAYVPFDVSQPDARLREIVLAAQLEHVLCDDEARWPSIDIARSVRTYSTTEPPHAFGTESSSSDGNPALIVPSADSLMTVLFTSGSTGRPKGVMLAHAGYQNRLRWMQKAFPIKAGDRIAYKTSCCFDVSIWEWLWPLMEGATVSIAEEEARKNPWALARWLREEGVAVVHFVPSLFREFIAALADKDRFRDLRWLIFSGEALPAPLVRAWMLRYGSTVGLANLYGPTEASIDVTAQIIDAIPAENELDVPIGLAIDNVSVEVLDEQQRPVTVGARGELWLGGIQLARGYLNEPESTRKAFPSNPLTGSGVLYRTGDLVSRDPDGRLHFHGRLDGQVKIRGYRIELGDVEANLSAVPGVLGCAVFAQQVDSGDSQLVAVVVPATLDIAALRAQAAERLPSYMVPQQWQLVSELPTNHNGKLDRKALQQRLQRETEPASPQQATQASARAAASPNGYGLAPAQNWLLAHYGRAGRWLGFTRFTYKEELDFGILCQALNWLLQRHDVLGNRFEEQDGEWRQVPGDEGLSLVPHYSDLALVPAVEQERAILGFRASALAELDLRRWPLLRVGVFRTGAARFEFVLVGHHMIADMLTNQILFRDLWRAYGELLGGETPSAREHRSYRQYVEGIAHLLADSDASARLREYWVRTFEGGKKRFFPKEREASRANDEASTRRVEFGLGVGSAGDLRQAARNAGCRAYEAIAAALYYSLARITGEREIVVSHRMHGRGLEGQNFFSTCGNFAVNFPVLVEVGPNSESQTLMPLIKRALAEVPWQGVSYDALGPQLPPAMYPDDRLTPIRLNFLPAMQSLPGALFETNESEFDQRYSDPEQVRSAEIECFAREVGGELRIVFDFGAGRWSEVWIRALAERMKQALEQIAAVQQRAERATRYSEPRPVEWSPRAQKVPQTARIEGSRPRQELSRPRQEAPWPVRQDASWPVRHEESSLSLNGKVAIVTGGGRGIGRAIALKLARRGARVVIAARTEQDLTRVAVEISAEKRECVWVCADLSTLAGAQAVMDRALSAFGRLDILVNNAGRTQCCSVLKGSAEDWVSVVATNLLGTFYMSKVAVPALVETQGVILNMGSDSSLIGYPLFSAYAASKHGIVGLTKSLAEELKPHNVQVNVICPAMVDTDMAPAGLRAQAILPEKIADVVAFLVSSEAEMITGECIRVYGKQDMYWYGSRQAQRLEQVGPPAARAPSNGNGHKQMPGVLSSVAELGGGK